jgi:hypothetical protein
MDEGWNEPVRTRAGMDLHGMETLRTGSALQGAGLSLEEDMETHTGSSTSLGTLASMPTGFDSPLITVPGPSRNDPALIRGGIGTASGVVTPSQRGQPVASALQRISGRCQIVVNIWDKRPLAATGVAVDRPPATQGTWRIGGRDRRV